jgi:hypothetical protein
METALKALGPELLRVSTKRMRTGEDCAELEDNLLYAKMTVLYCSTHIHLESTGLIFGCGFQWIPGNSNGTFVTQHMPLESNGILGIHWNPWNFTSNIAPLESY